MNDLDYYSHLDSGNASMYRSMRTPEVGILFLKSAPDGLSIKTTPPWPGHGWEG
jgi:hypothetical protein